MAAISLRKTMHTDIKVPKWTNTSKKSPCSWKLSNSEPSTKCPELETGKNSVSPCTAPNIIALIISNSITLLGKVPYQKTNNPSKNGQRKKRKKAD